MRTLTDQPYLEVNGRPCVLDPETGRLLLIPSGADDADRAAGEAGDDPSKERDDTEPDAEERALLGEEDGAAPDSGVAPKDDARIPKSRLDKALGKLKEFRELGLTPSEARARLTEWQQFKDAEARVRQHAEEQRRAATRDDRRESLKRELHELLEEDNPGMFDTIRETRVEKDLFRRKHNADGEKVIRGLLSDYGITPSDRVVARMRTLIGTEINANEDTLAAYWDPASQEGAIKRAFRSVATELFDPMLQSQGSGTLDQARERREKTLSRATPSPGPSRIDELASDAFSSKHPVGSPEWQDEFRKWSDKRQDDIWAAHGL